MALQDGAPPTSYECIVPGAAEIYAGLHAALLDRGVYLAPSAYEVIFVSLAHTEDDIDEAVAAFRAALGETS